jgi:hypothetical protein
MTTITIPSDLEARLVEEARQRGTTPELLAVDSLRKLFVPATPGDGAGSGKTLWDFLSGYVGTISGSRDNLSERCGRDFTDELIQKQQQGRL